jgi:hypothetical protein
LHSNLPAGSHIQEIVIVGLTAHGARFRPSDWAERLCGVVSQFNRDQRIRYSPYVTPVVADGVMCVVIDLRLVQAKPEAFEYLMWFAKDNELQLRAGRCVERSVGVSDEAAVSAT